MKSNYQKSLETILQHEGGYSDNPKDRGGNTNFGITQKTYDLYRTNQKQKLQSVKFITMVEIDKIYYNNYWLAANCDLLPSNIDTLIFDIAVNSGIKCAVQTLQRCLGVSPDGQYGEKSKHALVNSNMDKLYKDIIKDRILQYSNIVTKDNSQLVFLNGWMKRISSFI